MNEQDKRFRAFISYSKKDSKYARRLHKSLETYRVPKGVEVHHTELKKKRRIGRIFRDDDELSGSSDLGATLRNAIVESESLIVICSPNAVLSEWVNEEVLYFKRTGRKDRIFALIVAGKPNSKDPASECFVQALRFGVTDDGALTSEPHEPFGLDVRVESYSRILNRLVAGLIGVEFDDLWRRDKRRSFRKKLMLGFISLGFASVAIAGVASVFFDREVQTLYERTVVVEKDHDRVESTPIGERFRDCISDTLCPDWVPQMVVVPAGQLPIGELANEDQDENMRRQFEYIRIDSFAVSVHEVTYFQWNACADATNQSAPEETIRNNNPIESTEYIGCAPKFGEPNLPVLDVTWNEVQGYINWLNSVVSGRAENGPYRLLSDYEWEYAARGGLGEEQPYSTHTAAWEYACDQNPIAIDCNERFPFPVERGVPNHFGLTEMDGNAWEWTFSCHQELLGEGIKTEMGIDTEEDCSRRILRCASWLNFPCGLPSSLRIAEPMDTFDFNIGFRLARDF